MRRAAAYEVTDLATSMTMVGDNLRYLMDTMFFEVTQPAFWAAVEDLVEADEAGRNTSRLEYTLDIKIERS